MRHTRRALRARRFSFARILRYSMHMTKFGWAMLALIIAIVFSVAFFVWTGTSEHPSASSARQENQTETVVTSGDNPTPGSAVHDVPIPSAVDAARSALAARLGVANPKTIVILTAFEKEWSDTCLGLPKEGELCAQAITPGYEVTMLKDSAEYVYRTNADGTILRAQ